LHDRDSRRGYITRWIIGLLRISTRRRNITGRNITRIKEYYLEREIVLCR